MTSVHSSSLDVDEVDLSGLVESVVDSDEEDLAESMDVSLLPVEQKTVLGTPNAFGMGLELN